MRAPASQAFAGRPALRQVCERKVPRSHPVLASHLRQEEASPEALLHDEAVPPHFDVVKVRHRGDRGENGDLDGREGQFVGLQRGKAGILRRRGYGAVRDHLVEHVARARIPDAAAEVAVDVKRHERARMPAGVCERHRRRRRTAAQMRRERFPCEPQEAPPFLVGQHAALQSGSFASGPFCRALTMGTRQRRRPGNRRRRSCPPKRLPSRRT